MIYVCVPVHNEASTVGLVLWKVRQVFTAFEREYQIIACDDASTDGTADVLTSYARVLPLTVIKHPSRQGYARSLEELLRLALQRTDRPKRDCARSEEHTSELQSLAYLVCRLLLEKKKKKKMTIKLQNTVNNKQAQLQFKPGRPSKKQHSLVIPVLTNTCERVYTHKQFSSTPARSTNTS